MAVLAMEGFDHGNISSVDVYASMNDANISPSYGRFGGRGLLINGTGDYIAVQIPMNTYSTIYIGFAIKFLSLNYGSEATYQYDFFSTYDCNGNRISGLSVPNSAFAIQPFRYTSTSDTSGVWVGNSISMGTGIWYFIEMKFVINATVGEIIFKVNGQTVSTSTGLDTYINNLYFESLHFFNNQGYYIDDIYVTDDGFLGDVRVKGFVPDSNGSTNDFTASAGSNYECVDDVPATEETDYVSSNSPGDIDLYTITTGTLADVKAIQVRNRTRKDDAGTREVRSICRSNGSNYNGATVQPTDAYSGVVKHIWETDPDDSNAWTQTKLEAAEFGLEIVT